MNYNKIFDENKDTEFFFNAPGYPTSILVNGTVSLRNALERLKKGEFYVLVTYEEGEVLPKEYCKVLGVSSDDGKLFATINRDVRINAISMNGGIQLVSRLGRLTDNPVYLLGPGPEKVSLEYLVENQITEYNRSLDGIKERK